MRSGTKDLLRSAPQQFSNIHSHVERKPVQSKRYAARIAKFQAQHPRRLKTNPGIEAVLTGQINAGCRRLGIVLICTELKHLLRAERNNMISRCAGIHAAREIVLRAFFQMDHIAPRSKITRHQIRIRYRIAETGIYERRQFLEAVLEFIIPIQGAMSGAESFADVSRRHSNGERRRIIQPAMRNIYSIPK